MGLDATHPQYDDMRDEWVTMRDFYKGERVVKAKTEVYLPATPGMKLDGLSVGDVGYERYQAYLKRAVFPDYMKDGVEHLVGLLHKKDAVIELPPQLEPLRLKATRDGETLLQLLRRINAEQLTTGRLGLLLDLPKDPDPANPIPYIAPYIAEAVRNWDDGEAEGITSLNLVVLDESTFKRGTDFVWTVVTKYRVLALGALDPNEENGTAVYQMGVFEVEGGGSPTFNPLGMAPPMLRGKMLEQVPFVFVNTKDIVSSPDEPPLAGLARLVMSIYRSEADYRNNLFMQGQDTLVTIGGVRNATGLPGQDEDAIRTGAGSRIDCELGGDAKYIGVESQGLAEQRSALENDRKRAETKTGQLVAAMADQQESGIALKTRVSAQTATLIQIALTGAAALENLLKIAARWMGADENKVKVTPNVEFADFELDGKSFVDLMSARTMGAPLSLQSIHERMKERGITKMNFEDEMELVLEENAAMAPAPGTGTQPGTGTGSGTGTGGDK